MKTKKHIYFISLAIMILVVSGLPVMAAGHSIKLAKKTLTLNAGASYIVNATVVGPVKTVVWTSDAESVATVEDGKITAVSEGTATITASANDRSATCKVTVKPVINRAAVKMNVDDSLVLFVKGTDKQPVWSSSNVNIATVDANGTVVPVATGKVVIQARIGTAYYKSTVTIVDSSIKLNTTGITLFSEDYGNSAREYSLNARISGATKNIVWTSDNEAVATVDKKGKVISHKAGTAIVTATANNKSASCVVTVKDVSVSLNRTDVIIGFRGTGNSFKLIPVITGTGKNVKWRSSDSKTVAVSKSGVITGKKPGEANITVTANGVSASCHVIVKSGISMDVKNITLYTDLKDYRVIKTNATKNTVIEWYSEDTEIATVVNGKVEPVSEGTTIITAQITNADGTVDSDHCVVTVKETKTEIAEDEVTLKTKYTNTAKLSFSTVGKSGTKTFTSSNTKIATVSGSGLITAKKAGNCVITLKSNGKTDTVNVHVEVYDPKISLSKNMYTLYTVSGKNITLKATVDGPSKVVLWTSDNEDVATVDNKGVVTALSQGSCTISATANGVETKCLISVVESNIQLNTDNIHIDKNKTAVLIADITGASLTYTMKSSNSKIATVSAGVIKGISYGETDIIVKANGLTKKCHVVVAPCNHEYSVSEEKEPACTETGYKCYVCSLCGDSYRENTSELGHIVRDLGIVEEATCISGNIHNYDCERCGETWEENDNEPDGNKHSFLGEFVETKAATCYMEGEKTRLCSLCNKATETEVIEKTEHNISVLSAQKAYCEKDGYLEVKCKNSGCSYHETIIIPATGHDMEMTYYCSHTRYCQSYETWKCKNCIYQETRNIGTSEHTYDYEHGTIVREPSCNHVGLKQYDCSCGAHEYEKFGELQPHDFKSTGRTEPTCSSLGEISYKCTVCNATDYESIPTLEHTPAEEISITEEPTCWQPGAGIIYCTVCGSSVKEVSLPHREHEYEKVRIEPTETEDGDIRDECKFCHNTKNHETILSFEKQRCTHESYQRVKISGAYIRATCSTPFNDPYYCDFCGRIVENDYRGKKNPLNHSNYVKNVIREASPEQKGLDRYICEGCGDYYDIETIYGECNHSGERVEVSEKDNIYSVCCDCGVKLECIGEVCSHSIRQNLVREADEINYGIVEYRCSKCGYLEDTETIHPYKTYTIELENGETATIIGWVDSEYDGTVIDGENSILGDGYSRDVFNLLNEYRKELGYEELKWNYRTQAATDLRAVESAYFFSHTRPNGEPFTSTGIIGKVSGENLSMSHKTPESVMNGWKASDGHNANMLYSFNYVSIGVFHCYTFEEGNLIPNEEIYWSQGFVLATY